MAVVDYIRPRRSRLSRLAHRPAERPLTDDDLYRLTGRRRPSVVLAELLWHSPIASIAMPSSRLSSHHCLGVLNMTTYKYPHQTSRRRHSSGAEEC